MALIDSIRKAAKVADRAVHRAMTKYSQDLVTDEDDISGVLVGNLDTELDGAIGGLIWSSSIVRHRAGTAAQEKRIGADIVIHVALDTSTLKYSKGVLIQAKRVEPGERISSEEQRALITQCKRMQRVAGPASFVFDYARGSMRCASALKVEGLTSRELYANCDWTSYRFFFELFRCSIGNGRITSAQVEQLPVPIGLKLRATGQL
jgi:hypothetical protein